MRVKRAPWFISPEAVGSFLRQGSRSQRSDRARNLQMPPLGRTRSHTAPADGPVINRPGLFLQGGYPSNAEAG